MSHDGDRLMLSFNHFPQIVAMLHTTTAEVVRKTAFDIEAEAKNRAAVDTGNMAASTYAVTSESSDYGGGGQHLLPPIPAVENDHTAYVAVGANYGIYQEMGTHKMAAHPFLIPALEACREGFMAAMGALESHFGGIR